MIASCLSLRHDIYSDNSVLCQTRYLQRYQSPVSVSDTIFTAISASFYQTRYLQRYQSPVSVSDTIFTAISESFVRHNIYSDISVLCQTAISASFVRHDIYSDISVLCQTRYLQRYQCPLSDTIFTAISASFVRTRYLQRYQSPLSDTIFTAVTAFCLSVRHDIDSYNSVLGSVSMAC
jgi:hypothetical protein